MGLFGKKDKESGNSGFSPSKSKAASLQQLFHESVLSTAIDIFRQNDIFIHISNDDNETYIGVILDATDIGGIDKKSAKKDEAKGSIIQCINSGRLATFITNELLDMNYICFIPNTQTVEAMGEFSLLMNCPYEFCSVDEEGNVVLLGKKTNYTEIKELLDSDGSINELLGDNELVTEESSDDNVEADEDDDIPEIDEEAIDDDVEPVEDDEAIDTEDAFDIPEIDEEEDDIPEAGGDDTDSSLDSLYEDAARVETMPEQTIPPDVHQAAVTRRFYSSEFDIAITPDAFDAQFMQGGDVPRFEENRPDGWMNNQLNEMARNANIELERIRNNNLWSLRNMFFKLCASAYEDVRNALDISDASTNYGELVADLKREKAQKIGNIEEKIRDRKAELEEKWQRRLKEVGMEAARKAQHDFKEAHGKEHDAEIFNIETQIRSMIEDEYQGELYQLLQERKNDASVIYDMHVTEILEELSRMYEVHSSEEMRVYDELKEQMSAFAESCRKDDMTRASILEEELRQKDRADVVLAEKASEMEVFAKEQQLQRQKLVDEISEQKARYDARIDELHKESDDKVAGLEKELDAEKVRYADLSARFEHAEDIVARRYEAQIEEMREQNLRLAEAADHTADASSRSGRMIIFIAIIAVIASLAIGAVIGGSFMSKQYTDIQTQKIFDTYGTSQSSQTEKQTENNDESKENKEKDDNNGQKTNKEEW